MFSEFGDFKYRGYCVLECNECSLIPYGLNCSRQYFASIEMIECVLSVGI